MTEKSKVRCLVQDRLDRLDSRIKALETEKLAAIEARRIVSQLDADIARMERESEKEKSEPLQVFCASTAYQSPTPEYDPVTKTVTRQPDPDSLDAAKARIKHTVARDAYDEAKRALDGGS